MSSAHVDITNIADITNFASMGDNDFVDFQIACPRKWCGHFQLNSIKSNYSGVLQIDGVSASVLIPVEFCEKCEHGKKIDFYTFQKSRFLAVFTGDARSDPNG